MTTLKRFRPQRRNANKGKPAGLRELELSIRRDGYSAPMVAAADGEIFAGSKRLERAANVFGINVEPIIVESDGTRPVIHVRTDILSADDPRAVRLAVADNVVAAIDWQPDGEVLAALATEDAEIKALIDQDERSLAAIAEAASASNVDAEPQIDRAEELRVKWGVETGRSWRVGRSLVTCADSFTADATRAEIVVTDPPYEMSAKNVSSIIGRYADRAILLLSGKQAFEFLRESDGWEYRIDLVWRHRRPRWTGSNYMPVLFHNNIIVVAKRGVKTGFFSLAKYGSSVIETEREYVDSPMGHAKSVELFEKMMRGFKAQTVADPFLGTGPVVIACEQTGRRCIGVEQSPTTMAVALERFVDVGLTVVAQ